MVAQLMSKCLLCWIYLYYVFIAQVELLHAILDGLNVCRCFKEGGQLVEVTIFNIHIEYMVGGLDNYSLLLGLNQFPLLWVVQIITSSIFYLLHDLVGHFLWNQLFANVSYFLGFLLLDERLLVVLFILIVTVALRIIRVFFYLLFLVFSLISGLRLC